MITTAAPVSLRTIRRRRAVVGSVAVALLIVLVALTGGAAAGPVGARVFDVAVALGAVAAGWALVRELRATPAAVPSVRRAPVRTITVSRTAGGGRTVLADAA